MDRPWEKRRATLYCLDKNSNFRPFEKWTTKVTLTWAKDADDWHNYWFATKLKPAEFSRDTVAIVVTEEGDMWFYELGG